MPRSIALRPFPYYSCRGEMEADHELIGKIGHVTGTIEPGKMGEVMVPVRGGSESFYAYALRRRRADPAGLSSARGRPPDVPHRHRQPLLRG